MTAHDDDQDLVTIRVPRRAAAMYAAELDITSSPLAARLTVHGRILAGVTALLTSLAFSLTIALNVERETYSIVPAAIAAAVFSAFMGFAFLLFGIRYKRALRRRNVL